MERGAGMAFDREKFKRLVHYVAWKAGKCDWFGATKLNKVLWFAEARQFVLTRRSITGETYIREKYGPVPRHLMAIREELQSEGAIRLLPEPDTNLLRVIALTRPDTSLFSKEELRMVDYFIDYIDKNHTARSISDETHDDAWQMAKMGEELPLFAPLVMRIRDPDEREMQELKRQAREIGLC